jgi:GNAT superfamily N-acetyltransferase
MRIATKHLVRPASRATTSANRLAMDDDPISIRLMDSTYVMCDDEQAAGVTLDIHCRSLSPRWPNPLYFTYYRKLLEAYGLGPVLVWEGRRVVGFLPVSIVNCGIPELPLCVHYSGGLAYGAERHIDLPMIAAADPLPFDDLQVKEIRIGCMTLHPRLQGKGVAAAMIDYLADRAQKGGWHAMKARAMIDGEPEAFYPTASWWKRHGFKPVGSVRPFGPSADPIDRADAIDLVLDLRT